MDGQHAKGKQKQKAVTTMLPPVEESVLQNNPDFTKLYKTLTTVVLNDDGSSKNDAGAKQRDAVRQELRNVRLREARKHLIVEAISTAAPQAPAADVRSGAAARRAARVTTGRPMTVVTSGAAEKTREEVPQELADLLVLLPALLQRERESAGSAGEGLSEGLSEGLREGQTPSVLSDDDVALLLASPPLSRLPEHLPRLAALVSVHLQTAALGLARVASPTTNPSFLHRGVPALPGQAAALQAAVAAAQVRLTAARQATATAVLRLQDQQAAALAALLRALEAKHGPVGRSLELRAAEVALAAQTSDVEARTALAAGRRAVYPPEAVTALRRYAGHLRDSQMRLDEALRERRALLAEYGVDVDREEEGEVDADGDADGEADGGQRTGTSASKEKTMREMARVYRQMERQMKEVQGDLARLGRA